MGDIFGDSDDDGDEGMTESFEHLVWLELMKIRPALKRKVENRLTGEVIEVVLSRSLCLVGRNPDSGFLERLIAAGFIITQCESIENATTEFDVLVVLDSIDPLQYVETVQRSALRSGAVLLLRSNRDDSGVAWQKHLSESKWSNFVNAGALVGFRRRSVICNTSGAIYWGATGPSVELTAEMALIEDLSIPLSMQERQHGVLSDESHRRTLRALEKHGVCILCGLMDPKTVLTWGEAAKIDMKEIISKLLQRGIDLLNPGTAGQPRIENFHELSMREALRCDIRNGRAVNALTAKEQAEAEAQNGLKNSSAPIVPMIVEAGGKTWHPSNISLRSHPAVNEILLDVMNPRGDPLTAKGNWGRWNFEGPGPDGPPPPLAIGKAGTVMSLPGCADQTIHADTSHLFVHTQLPGHYYNLFFPAVGEHDGSSDLSVGQTAFVVGTHELSLSAKVMTQAGGQEELNRRLIRPHLRAGDALIFDCRILHFGLANQSSDIFRPLIYVNHHQTWFVDPKNWNDKERLFER